jgi:endoglucanase
MKKVLLLSLILSNFLFPQKSWIRINQLGYLEKSLKTAVFLSMDKVQIKSFDICDALTDEIVQRVYKIKSFNTFDIFLQTYRLDFSDFEKPGAYYIRVGEIISPNFPINNNIYEGTADFLLQFLRQQRCGYNPFIGDSCHTNDGFAVNDSVKNSLHINVVGGWHTSSNYLKDASISAVTVFQLLFAYQQNPGSFKDRFDQLGNPWANGIPDILDEAKWGIDWLIKMNPSANVLYSQVGDDRQLNSYYLPNKDITNYGKIIGRPVYYCTGKPQGLSQIKNSTNGLASITGKFTSAYALGSQLLGRYFLNLPDELKNKAFKSYALGKKYPGITQPVTYLSPGLNEEKNYFDDMELASYQLYKLSSDKKLLNESINFANQGILNQSSAINLTSNSNDYSNLNFGNYYLGNENIKKVSPAYIDNLKIEIDHIKNIENPNPFLMGIPFNKRSDNYIASVLTSSRMYFLLTGKSDYQETEAAMRDWLFGCNPWGICMVTGLTGNSVKFPFSSIQLITNKIVEGGLVSGPVNSGIFEKEKIPQFIENNKLTELQLTGIKYFDDNKDFVTNEPTLEGTTGLLYYLSSIQKEGSKYYIDKNYQYTEGAIIRTDRSRKEIHIVFVGTEFANGGDYIRKVLQNQKIKAHFFFSGDFYRKAEFAPLIYNLKKDGQYLGALSDKDIHYTFFYNRDSVQITKNEFKSDLLANYIEMGKFKIKKSDAKILLPPYQVYNQTISDWTKELGLQLINFTPGIISLADTTLPDMPGYKSSDEIYNQILDYEKNHIDGLNGVILAAHIGYDPKRTDKFFLKFDKLFTELKKRGYNFTLIDY